jgi:hypothetical protein
VSAVGASRGARGRAYTLLTLGYDFNVSLLAFDPGAGLDKVEIHDEEHGLYMTAGTGIYQPRWRRPRGGRARLHLHGPVLSAVIRRHRVGGVTRGSA